MKLDVQGQGRERILDVDGQGGMGSLENWTIVIGASSLNKKISWLYWFILYPSTEIFKISWISFQKWISEMNLINFWEKFESNYYQGKENYRTVVEIAKNFAKASINDYVQSF